jgi:hypothetical protein
VPPPPPEETSRPVVDNARQTDLAAGLSAYQGGDLAIARAHLDAAGPEGRYPLALVLESLGETEAARKLLQELPDSEAIRQGLARLESRLPGPALPAGERRWIMTGQVLSVAPGGEALRATGPDGAVKWQMNCGDGPVTDLVFEAGARRAILFTAAQGCLFNPATGARLGTTPGSAYYASIEGFAWRGDLVAFGEDISPRDPKLAAGYFGTNWKVYRLQPDGGVKLLYEAKDGSRMAALSADGRTLFSWFGNHGAGRARRFRDGQLVTDYGKLVPVGAEFALDPRDDRFYLANYLGYLQAYTLEGKRLWEAPAQDLPLTLWPGDDGRLLLVVRETENSTAVYDDQGARMWGAPGWPGLSISRFLLVRGTYENLLCDRAGRVVARYPLNTYFTADGKALYLSTEGGVALYRLPD